MHHDSRSRPSAVQLPIMRSSGWWEVGLDLIAAVAATVEAARQVAEGSSAIQVLILVIAVVGVAGRRWFPRAAGTIGILITAITLTRPESSVALWVMTQVILFGVALRASRRDALIAGTLMSIVLYGGTTVILQRSFLDANGMLLLTWTLAVVGVGLSVRGHWDRLAALQEAASAILAARDSDVERHVADERLRIARDLHDSVAHTIAVISVHASAAERALPRRPEEAKTSMREIRRASGAALNEIQQILRLLRSVHGDEAQTGDETLRRIGILELIETVRGAGLAISAVLPSDEALTALDGVTAATLSRVVQEMLTNAQKHGNGRVDLEVVLSDRYVKVRAENRINDSGAPLAPGFGLVGMRERASSIAGNLDISSKNGNFTVTMTLPYTTAQTDDTDNTATAHDESRRQDDTRVNP